jgi:hypothetical protein
MGSGESYVPPPENEPNHLTGGSQPRPVEAVKKPQGLT